MSLNRVGPELFRSPRVAEGPDWPRVWSDGPRTQLIAGNAPTRFAVTMLLLIVAGAGMFVGAYRAFAGTADVLVVVLSILSVGVCLIALYHTIFGPRRERKAGPWVEVDAVKLRLPR